MEKKKASFSFVFIVLRGERCENGKKKNEDGRGVIGCQIVRRGEGKMKSQDEGRGGENAFTIGIAGHRGSLGKLFCSHHFYYQITIIFGQNVLRFEFSFFIFIIFPY